MNQQKYKAYTENRAKRSPWIMNAVKAFAVGGLICCMGQGLVNLYLWLGLSEKSSGTVTSVTLIFAAGLLTGIGIFDKIAKHAGAGTLVPITGFANAVASPAIDSHSEGLILGVGAKIFSVAGPVLLYGTLAGFVYGVVLWLIDIISM